MTLGRPLYRFDRVTSTMDVLGDLAAAGAPEGATVVAGFQEAGRGRADRRWIVPPDRALLASVLLRPAVHLHRLMPLSILVADAVREAVASLYQLDARVKWPNDVLIDGRKLSGVLIQTKQAARPAKRTPVIPSSPPVIPSAVEGSRGTVAAHSPDHAAAGSPRVTVDHASGRGRSCIDPLPRSGRTGSPVRNLQSFSPTPVYRPAGDRADTGPAPTFRDVERGGDRAGASPIVIVGFGINANVEPADLPPTGTSLLAEIGHPVDRDALLEAVLAALEVRYREMLDDRLESRWTRLGAHLAMRGEWVVVSDAGRTVTGRLTRIDRDGALVLQADGREHRIVAGDLSRGPRTVDPGGVPASAGKPGILP